MQITRSHHKIRTPPKLHWRWRESSIRSYCGVTKDLAKMTSEAGKVGCLLCQRQMKLHGHLPEGGSNGKWWPEVRVAK